MGALAIYYDMLNDFDQERDRAAQDGAQQEQGRGAEEQQHAGSDTADIQILMGQKCPWDNEMDQGRPVHKTIDLSLLHFKKRRKSLWSFVRMLHSCSSSRPTMAAVRNEIIIDPASGNPYMVTFASMNQIIQMKTNEVGKCIILLIVGFLVTLQVLVVTFYCFSVIYCKICIN
jgi:hypothetical protein